MTGRVIHQHLRPAIASDGAFAGRSSTILVSFSRLCFLHRAARYRIPPTPIVQTPASSTLPVPCLPRCSTSGATEEGMVHSGQNGFRRLVCVDVALHIETRSHCFLRSTAEAFREGVNLRCRTE